MIYLDSVPDMINGQDPYAFYILKVKTDGELLGWTVSGSNNRISARSMVERNGTVAVLGQFECSWTDMTTIHGADKFLAVGDQDLFVARFDLASLARIDEQQFGGPQEKLAGQIVAQPNDDLVFTGSFERGLVFPADLDVFATTAPPIDQYTYLYPYSIGICNDPLMGSFAGLVSYGLKDGFISKGFVEGRSPYDWWNHTDTACVHVIGDICITANYDCVDSVVHCGPLQLILDTEHSVTITDSIQDVLTVGPELDILWSNGDTTFGSLVNATGWYSVLVEQPNGCLSWTDSIWVVINPLPAKPLLSDDVIVNTDEAFPGTITLCDPDTALVWVSNPDPNCTYTWVLPFDTVPLLGLTCVVDTSGFYTVVAMTAEGCSRINGVEVVDLPPVPMPNLSAAIAITYPQDADLNDSIQVCPSEGRHLIFDVEWSVNGSPYTIPLGLTVYYQFNGEGWTASVDNNTGQDLGWQSSTGWYTDVLEIMVVNAPCLDDTLIFTLTDSIYVEVLTAPVLDLEVTGPQLVCDGDTALWNISCIGCDSWSVNPSWTTTIIGDSLLVVDDVFYYIDAYVVDTVTGCSAGEQVIYELFNPGVPELFVDPSDGIICPNATATISTNAAGTDYIWYGPLGPVPNGQPSVIVDTPGEYYMTMINTMGCALASDPILITGYATPFLNVTPDGIICLNDPDDEVTLQVVTTNYTSLVWDAPLSGNALVQVVDQPGTYSCSVTGCGITTDLTVTVVAGVADAQVLTPGPISICPGETTILEGAPGQAIYIWDPGQVYASQVSVSEEGSYTLTVIDGNGCTDTSDPVLVDIIEFAQPAVGVGDTICAGDTAVVTATGSGVLTWYADALMQNLLGTGTQLVVTGVQTTSTVFLVQSDSVCAGALAIPVSIVVQALPAFEITGPATACTGTSAQFNVPDVPGLNYTWSTPGGNLSGIAVVVDPVTSADAGTYICTAQNGCATASDTLLFNVVNALPLSIGPDTSICPGESVTFILPAGFTSPVWNGSVQAPQYTTGAEGQVELMATDTNGCISNDMAYVDVLQFSIPATATGADVCSGTTVVLTATGSGLLTWYTDNLGQNAVGTGSILNIGAPQSSTVYYLVQEENGCAATTIAVPVDVTPMPVDVSINGPALVCQGEAFTLLVNAQPPVDADWTLPDNSTFSGNPYTVLSATMGDAGLYTVTPLLGPCVGAPVSWNLNVVVPQPLDLGLDTSFCVGGSVDLLIPAGFTSPIWSTGSTAAVITVATSGTYSAEANDGNGCLVTDEVLVEMIDCELILPTVFTPNGDGRNDLLGIDFKGTTKAEMVMYDRFGLLVFEGDLRQQAWDGTNSRTNEPVSEGVYFYVLTLHPYTGELTTHQGYVQVLR
ncbi:MAG: gliding motility-associated C-terminal domain-containing protein [Flavobacteriales bacterium]|nr:gliding motility-associated C-terminal domain-containing protein [Flavobacteriales bacterium]